MPPEEEDPTRAARLEFVDLVGTEISAIWRNVTRLGGQCVASLYLHDEPRSMDELAEELGRSKSNVFANLRALEALGIVRRVRISGSAKDHFELSGDYPDVLVVAFARHLSHALSTKSADLRAIAARLDEDEATPTDSLSGRIRHIADTYAAVGSVIGGLLPPAGESMDLSSVIGRITPGLVKKTMQLFRRKKS